MPGRDVVVVGSSAGGIDPLMRLVADLPPDFPASIFVVHHFPARPAGGLAVDRVLPLDDIAGGLEALMNGSGKGAA